MQQHLFSFLSANGKTPLHVMGFVPEEGIRGIVQIAHGMKEYMGRYKGFMQALCKAGYAVYGHDHLGHGLSADPKDLGFFDEEKGLQYLVEDMHALTRLLKEKHPGLPLVLMGHSMGSMLAECYVSSYGEELAGLILMGSLGPMKFGRISLMIANREVKKQGPRGYSDLLEKAAFGSYNKAIKDPASPNSWLSVNEKNVERYDKDPLCTYRFTASAFRDLVKMNLHHTDKGWPDTLPMDLPVLFISGEDDPCGDYGKGVVTMFTRLQARGMKKVTLALYPGLRHEILHESAGKKVTADIRNWLKNSLPKGE